MKAPVGFLVIVAIAGISLQCSNEPAESTDARGRVLKMQASQLPASREGQDFETQMPREQGSSSNPKSTSDKIEISEVIPSSVLNKRFGITSSSHIAIFTGNTLVLKGYGLKPGMVLKWDVPLAPPSSLVVNEDGNQALLHIPKDLPRGLIEGVITKGLGAALSLLEERSLAAETPMESENDVRIRLLHLGEESSVPVYSGSPDNICSGQLFVNLRGETLQGTKNCSQLTNDQVCTKDGEENCRVEKGFRAVLVEKLVPEKIRSGHRIAGVAGQEPVCSKDGARDCFVSSDSVYAAARLDSFKSSDIRKGITIAGRSGSLEIPIPPSLCQTDGQTSCLLGTGFVAASIGALAAQNIRTGVRLGGVLGELIPSPPQCQSAQDSQCVVGQNGLVLVNPQSIEPSDVRYGVRIAGVTGSLQIPAPPPGCQADGQTSCLLGAGYVATSTGALSPLNIRTGVRLGGVLGELIPSPPQCQSAQDSQCVVGQNGLVLVNPQSIEPSDIRYGVRIAGVTGSLQIPAPPPGCQADGQTSCLLGAGYVAASTGALSPLNIRTGVRLGGVLGELVPSPSLCQSVSDSQCVVDANFKLVTPQSLKPENIRVGVTIGQVLGNVIPTPVDCAAEGQQECVVKQIYMALKKSSLTPGNIRQGSVIGGITGAYPSSQFPLQGASSVSDLDLNTFEAKIKNSADFEWFDSRGTRYVYHGDEDIKDVLIKNGVSIFGTAGLLQGGLSCQADGEMNCVTTNRFISADTQSFNSWDIRYGRQVGGVQGKLTFFKNMAKTDLYDRMNGPHSFEGVDHYDTTDDHANVGTFPTENPPGFVQATGANWIREETTDDGRGNGTPDNGICDGNEVCLYRDLITGLTWLAGDGVQRTFDNAINHCESLVRGGMKDFRLPTQKELLQAYVNGIWSLKEPTKLNIMAFNWSASTVSYGFDSAWLIYLNYGYSAATVKTSKAAVLCVHGL